MIDAFSATYYEAQAKFMSAAEAANASITRFNRTSKHSDDAQAPSLDVAWIGPAAASRILISFSGTHGAEGFVGSAAQTAWLVDQGPGTLPADTAMLMIHAVNPFGFANVLRCTESNVDVNRNWVDFAAPLPRNLLYEDMHSFLCPTSIDDTALGQAADAVSRLGRRHGQWTVDDALSRGQYVRPDGYYFGGHSETWSRKTITRVVQDMPACVRAVALIDWHSGPVGDGELIYLCYADKSTDAFQVAESWWGRSNLDEHEVDRLWGGRRPSRRGIMVEGVADLLKDRARVAGGVIEICSASPPSGPTGTFRIPMIERWMRFEGGLDAPQAADLREEIRDNYAPRRQVWEDRAVENTLGVYAATLEGLASWE